MEEQNAVCMTTNGEAVACSRCGHCHHEGMQGPEFPQKAGGPDRCLGLSGFKTLFQGTCEMHGPQASTWTECVLPVPSPDDTVQM